MWKLDLGDNMRILVLDDDQERLKSFRSSLIGHVVVTVSTVRDCLCQLQNENWDLVTLDHDLDGQVYVPSGPGTGYEVAEWLRDNPLKKPEKIILHTFNQLGAAKMMEILPEAQYIPGAWLISF
jgi:CheY-like chemotaxis protein